MKFRITHKVTQQGVKYCRFTVKGEPGKMSKAISEARRRTDEKYPGAYITLVSATPVLKLEDVV